VHVDKVDPRFDALGHLVHDSPETLAVFGFGHFDKDSGKSSHKNLHH
jgi:hypothetical protein